MSDLLDRMEKVDTFGGLITAVFHLLSIVDVSKLDETEFYNLCYGLIQINDQNKEVMNEVFSNYRKLLKQCERA